MAPGDTIEYEALGSHRNVTFGVRLCAVTGSTASDMSDGGTLIRGSSTTSASAESIRLPIFVQSDVHPGNASLYASATTPFPLHVLKRLWFRAPLACQDNTSSEIRSAVQSNSIPDVRTNVQVLVVPCCGVDR